MPDTAAAFLIDRQDNDVKGALVEMPISSLEADSPWVLIEAHYSSIGYKDALAATGRGRILRRFPLIGGQDVAGRVVESEDPEFAAGDAVVLTGHGLGEAHNGGLSQMVRVPSSWPIKIPAGLSMFDTMALGTAGFTAAQAIVMMEHNRQSPELGPIVVTGATGGVGSVAIDVLSRLGYSVIALTSRPAHRDYLMSLGADEVCTFDALALGSRLLDRGRFGGVIDNLGGETLQRLLPHVRPLGNVACIGLAQAAEFQASVMPFIIRGVNLLGINSTYCPRGLRETIWTRLATDMRPNHFDQIVSRIIDLDAIMPHFEDLLERRAFGRMVVRCRPEVSDT